MATEVWEPVEGGAVAGTGVNSVREFAEAIAGPDTDRPLVEAILDLEEDPEAVPEGDELVAALELRLTELGVAAELVPEEIVGLERWPSEGILDAALDEPTPTGYVKVLSASF